MRFRDVLVKNQPSFVDLVGCINTYKMLSIAANHALIIVLVSLDHTSTTFQLKIKEAINIQWEKPSLNHQLYHINLKLSL